MKKILVTGAYGLVGTEACRFFMEKGWEVIGIDNNQRSEMFDVPYTIHGDTSLSMARYYESDIRDEEAIDAIFNANDNFNAIIHAAAQPSHDYAKDHVMEDFDINARATVLLLEATRKYCPEATFVYVSTDKVYGQNMVVSDVSSAVNYGLGFSEGLGLDFAGKRSFFGCSKTAADIYVQEYGNYFGMKTACFRPGCITGKNHKGAELHGFLSYLVKCIKEEKPYTIFGDGSTVRDQIHVYDLVNALWHFIQRPTEGAVYNMGGGPYRSMTIIGAINRIEDATGKTAILKYGKERKGDRRYDVHDVSNFEADYPAWDYEYSLEDIIDELCA